MLPRAKGGGAFANDLVAVIIITIVGLAVGALHPHQAGSSVADGAVAVIGVAIIGVVAEMGCDGGAGADQADVVGPDSRAYGTTGSRPGPAFGAVVRPSVVVADR